MLRRLCSILALILVTGFVAFGQAAPATAQDATPSTGSPARTDIRYVLPFGPDGLNPGLTATATEEGVCRFPSSAALDRPDAWDCIGAEDQIYDPCFENAFIALDEPGEVACLASPFSTEVVVLTLTDPLVREKDVLDAGPSMAQAAGVSIDPWDLPWALELANGDRCSLLHGTLTVMAGQTVYYGCVEGGMVLGETDRSQPVWTVSYLPQGDIASTIVEVTVAWS
jgi:hypothetical protein